MHARSLTFPLQVKSFIDDTEASAKALSFTQTSQTIPGHILIAFQISDKELKELQRVNQKYDLTFALPEFKVRAYNFLESTSPSIPCNFQAWCSS